MTIEKPLHDLIIKLYGWVQALIVNLPNLVAAILVLLLFWLVARLSLRILKSLLPRVSRSHTTNEVIEAIVYVAIMATGVFVALGVLGLDKTVTSLLAGVGIVGLAFGLAFQSTGENLVTGLYFSLREPFRVGQIIESNDVFGTVERMAFRATWIRVPSGQIVLIPNKSVFANSVTNYSDTGKRRVDLQIGVSYGDDLEKVKRIACEAVKSITNRDPDRAVEFFYHGFGDSSINFEIRFWIDFFKQTDYLGARSQAVMAIKRAFDENDITIPFPIRTLDFASVGGKTLAETVGETALGQGQARMPPRRDA